MEAKIINRGRGPEIEGTRITVYRIMDFVRYESPPEKIARDLNLTPEQVQVGLDYIDEHRDDVEREYEKILERVNQPNPPEFVAGQAKSAEELKARIARKYMKAAHADSSGGQ